MPCSSHRQFMKPVIRACILLTVDPLPSDGVCGVVWLIVSTLNFLVDLWYAFFLVPPSHLHPALCTVYMNRLFFYVEVLWSELRDQVPFIESFAA